MKAESINELISQLRKKGKRVLTNAFGHFVWDKETECVFSDDSIVVCEEDHGVKRLFFYSINPEDLATTIGKLDLDAQCVLEVMARNKDEFAEVLEKAGLRRQSNMMRMSNGDIGELLASGENPMALWEEGHGVVPSLEDAKEINRVLWEIFDTRISHLLDEEEVRQAIEDGQFVVEKEHEKIIAVLQYQREPKKFYINQIYNAGDRKVIHSILIQELRKYHEAGGKYVYAWVEEDNIASVKFHTKYGLKHDGIWNVVYVGNDED